MFGGETTALPKPEGTLNSIFRVRLLSPIGNYPEDSYIGQTDAFISGADFCCSISELDADESGFSEIDDLSPSEIPILGTMLLCVKKGEVPLYPYPVSLFVQIGARAPRLNPEVIGEGIDALRSAVNEKEYGLTGYFPFIGRRSSEVRSTGKFKVVSGMRVEM